MTTRMWGAVVLIVPVLLGACASTGASQGSASVPGSLENPIRADMPVGQRAYLARLRCADGGAPRFARLGNMGPGRDGHIIDGYQVACPGEPSRVVHMDMYHRGHVEVVAPEGFAIAPPEGR